MQPDELENLQTLRDWVRWGASRFNEAGLFFGHGTDNALDEALLLVLHAIHLDYQIAPDYMAARLTNDEKLKILGLFERRIDERLPAAYLTGTARFAGLEFEVNENVLVPRSPIAELIEESFSPWVQTEAVNNVLDLGTGSGCIGIACAYAFADATVDLADISSMALDVAQRNIERHYLNDRVRVVKSDVFSALQGKRYDLIVSNPPYVSIGEMDTLPREYRQEPALGLTAGDDGMDVVSRILGQAADYLAANGIIVIEVGASADLLMARYPDVPFLWLDFERGGDGVFLFTVEQLIEYRDYFLEN